jgi:dihydroxyacetone kinase
MAEAIADAEEELGRLDSLAGDGDHGAGMVRGMTAAATAAASSGPRGSDVLKAAALAFSDAAGGASGALWGVGLLAAGESIAAVHGSARDTLEEEPDVAAIQPILAAALAAIMRLGGALPGDKTMVDALEPFVAEFGGSAERSVSDAWTAAAAAATAAAGATANLASSKGRAAVHGDRSRGTPDPGAVSLAVALTAAGKVRLAT